MKAVVYHKYGTPDVLRLEEVDKPGPKDDEVLIHVRAAEATKADCELRSFNFPVKWFWLPLRIAFGLTKPRRPILGGYLAGEVEAVGKNVTRFKTGDRVFGSTGFKMGAYGEYVCLPESATLVHKPATMSFEEAAAVPLGGLNALHYMRRANIQTGEKVLVNGAGGSIGTFGIQIAKALGA
ncbi:MAG: NAD(P)-dependent alcohol dehydrogenase, partial [Bacteroidetes bacterium]|nr:NAD(P)-dependent alcohol dehydrogenase [Bacteroidota bacterium]